MERPIHEIAIEKCGFYLPEEARYDWLLNLPESEDLAKKVKEAMEVEFDFNVAKNSNNCLFLLFSYLYYEKEKISQR